MRCLFACFAPLAAVLVVGCKGAASAPASAADVDASGAAALSIQSSAFAQGAAIPKTFTCDGGDASPPLTWGGAPAATKSFALIVDDPDAPSGTFTHWVLFDVPGATASLAQSSNGGGTEGKNDFGKTGYGGPCPPAGKPHRYFFRLYALDTPKLGPAASAARSDVESAMQGHVVAKGETMGIYGR